MDKPSGPQPAAIEAVAVAPRAKATIYPEHFAARVRGRERALGDVFGLKNFGVNLTRLAPGAQSALKHRHSRQDEFVFILEGEPTLLLDADEITLRAGTVRRFPLMPADAINRTDSRRRLPRIGDRARRN
jgi:uncharacterized cupin superfamily protein